MIYRPPAVGSRHPGLVLGNREEYSRDQDRDRTIFGCQAHACARDHVARVLAREPGVANRGGTAELQARVKAEGGALRVQHACIRRRNHRSTGNPDADPITASMPHSGHMAVSPPSIHSMTSQTGNLDTHQKHPHRELPSSSERFRKQWSCAITMSSSRQPDAGSMCHVGCRDGA